MSFGCFIRASSSSISAVGVVRQLDLVVGVQEVPHQGDVGGVVLDIRTSDRPNSMVGGRGHRSERSGGKAADPVIVRWVGPPGTELSPGALRNPTVPRIKSASRLDICEPDAGTLDGASLLTGSLEGLKQLVLFSSGMPRHLRP